VDSLLRTATGRSLLKETGAAHITTLARQAIDSLRRELSDGINAAEKKSLLSGREEILAESERRLAKLWQIEKNANLRRVINASGVVIHTNLGRAPISDAARRAIAEEAAGYCNLEYNLETGKRGRRGANAEQLIAELTGAESALIVNNCAAAAFLVLTVFGNGGEAIISRGELVEIGGDFRVPDVMTQSGVKLVEVGTTNRTRIADFERAINENTRIILKVHPSNYRIIGFTAAPTLLELSELAHKNNLIFFEDAGSGALFDLSKFGLGDEPIIGNSIAAGADLVTFSGDKLLGGVQSGLIVGKNSVIEKLRRHRLYRVLRVDKIAYAALEATLESFRRSAALEEIPVLRMLSMSHEELQNRANRFGEKIRERIGDRKNLNFTIEEGNSVIGGGSAPSVQPPTALIAFRHSTVQANKLDAILRQNNPPVITRILDDKILIDLRTVSENEEEELLAAILKIAKM
jgi:L-seryl-tRNA(Ser) seleniumtransferase